MSGKNPLLKAIVVASGKQVQVYAHIKEDMFVDFSDCKTIYNRNQLKFL